MNLVGRRFSDFLAIQTVIAMAGVIGVIASVITVTQVLSARTSVKLAKTYLKAAEELDKLQASVPYFSLVKRL